MYRLRWCSIALAAGMLALPQGAGVSRASSDLAVEVWTDRGSEAVYQPGDRMQVKARTSDDAYLLVYEIDAEGYVRLLFPYRGGSGLIEGRQTYLVPPERSNIELVVQEPVGQCYIVAVASRARFGDLPWYLRPYDAQAQGVGYEGEVSDEEGITREGQIVGDPFVAMERIRRRVLSEPDDAGAFATSYTSYYVHHEVRYPRYLCYDCHRPGYWAWWPGFDPYYATCSVFTMRVNFGWYWGPGYWFGAVPYYYYVPRYDCPAPYYSYYANGACYSSWNGWHYWNSMWGGRLIRYKTDPPSGYAPPSKYPGGGVWKGGKAAPPGYLVTDVRRGREGMRAVLPIGRNLQPRSREGGLGAPGETRRLSNDLALSGRGVSRLPLREAPGDYDRGSPSVRVIRGGRSSVEQPLPRWEAPRGEAAPRVIRPRQESPAPRRESAPQIGRSHEQPLRSETPRSGAPRYESPRMDRGAQPAPRGQSAPRGYGGRPGR